MTEKDIRCDTPGCHRRLATAHGDMTGTGYISLRCPRCKQLKIAMPPFGESTATKPPILGSAESTPRHFPA